MSQEPGENKWAGFTPEEINVLFCAIRERYYQLNYGKYDPTGKISRLMQEIDVEFNRRKAEKP